MAESERDGLSFPIDVRELTVSFPFGRETKQVVRGLTFSLQVSRTLGLVGESGCGKTLSALALMGLVPAPGRVTGSVRLMGTEMVGKSEAEWKRVRGRDVAMVFQEPITALNPVMRVGHQIAEVLVLHQGKDWCEAEREAVELLNTVQIPLSQWRARSYPHELSGGMRQRVMIAMALACRPAVLIADEPTTALDVTIQAQILDLMRVLQADFRVAILFISHNLAVVSQIADEIAVVYDGSIVEYAPTAKLFTSPAHPYTRALIETLPKFDQRVRRLPTIPDHVNAYHGAGCRFAPRCQHAREACWAAPPPTMTFDNDRRVACFEART